MTNLEDCTCWSSCCDLGPHSCICGNDCPPPPQATPSFIKSPSKVFLGEGLDLKEGWGSFKPGPFDHFVPPMQAVATFKFKTKGLPKQSLADLLGIPISEIKVPLEPRPEYDGGWKAWAEKHLVDYVHPHDLYHPDDSKAQRHAVVMKDNLGRKTIRMPNALVEVLRGNVHKISTERSWVVWTPRLVWKALLWVPRHPRPFIHTFREAKP